MPCIWPGRSNKLSASGSYETSIACKRELRQNFIVGLRGHGFLVRSLAAD
jgi:hypothetical protein